MISSPKEYSPNKDRTEILQVETGKLLRLEFTDFGVQTCGDVSSCPCHYVKITDGDGTVLMDRSCGFSHDDPSTSEYFNLPIITSQTNRVEIFFHTGYNEQTTGWRLSWSAVTPGGCHASITFAMKYLIVSSLILALELHVSVFFKHMLCLLLFRISVGRVRGLTFVAEDWRTKINVP